MTTLNTMVKRVAGLAGTKDLTPWEQRFVEKVVEQTNSGSNTTSLTERQITSLEELHDKHFAG